VSNKENIDKIDYTITKVSQSTEMIPRKFVSKIEHNPNKKLNHERSPLIRHDKLGEDLLSGGQSDLEND
jgi:hypothetical protein